MATATSPSRPRFRQDLVAEPIDEGGQRYIDVIDPDTGNAYRFYEVEYSLACAMDGERDVAGLATWAQEELGITPTSSELASVIATLGDLGYLDPAGAADVAVGVGVVAPVAPQRPAGIDVELGHAGADRRPMDRDQPVDDVALGRPGAGARSPAMTARSSTGALGPAGPTARPDPSKTPAGGIDVDLSADLPLAASDVKEAVRASKVIKATELPPDLEAALHGAAEPATKPPVAREPVRPVVPQPVRPREPTPPPVTAKEPPRVGKEPTRPPVEIGRDPPRVKHPTMPPDVGGRTSPVLIFLLVVVVLGAGGFAFWKYYWVPRHKQTDDTSKVVPPTAPVEKVGSGSAAVTPPPVAPPLEAVLQQSTPAPLEIQAPLDGAIGSITADGTAVAQGDEIARLAGASRLADDLKTANREVARVQNQIDKLQPLRDAASGAAAAKLDRDIKDRMDSLAKKQADKAKVEAEIEKFVIRAPAAGTLKPVAAKGKKVAANEVVASIQPAGVPTATFELRPGKTFTQDQDVTLLVAGGGDKLGCKVTEVAGTKLVVTCPVDGAPADGTKVILP